MKSNFVRALVVTLICLSVSYGILAATMAKSVMLGPFPAILVCAVFAFVVQWVAFVPAYIYQTEKFYDLAGSLSFIGVALIALYSAWPYSLYSVLLAAMVLCWAIRLGSFLFIRIKQDGSDDRFEHLKPNKYRFFIAWTVQGLWVFLTSCAALIAITSNTKVEFSWVTAIGCIIWCVGFFIEVVADRQKRAFKRDSANKGMFITTGLWSYSRHPNYFGEIMLWIGVAIVATPAFSGWQYVALISPIFVVVLLTKVSGVPLLEAKAEKKWGQNQNYLAYKQKTPVLVPFIKSS